MAQPVKIRFSLVDEGTFGGETVWAAHVTDDHYRLLNIPWLASGYAEGDVVRCVRREGWNEVAGMAQDSRNGTLRLVFTNSESAAARRVLEELTSVGCTYERASPRLVGVTVPAHLDVPFSQLSNYLNGLPDDVLPGWEVAKRPVAAG